MKCEQSMFLSFYLLYIGTNIRCSNFTHTLSRDFIKEMQEEKDLKYLPFMYMVVYVVFGFRLLEKFSMKIFIVNLITNSTDFCVCNRKPLFFRTYTNFSDALQIFCYLSCRSMNSRKLRIKLFIMMQLLEK